MERIRTHIETQRERHTQFENQIRIISSNIGQTNCTTKALAQNGNRALTERHPHWIDKRVNDKTNICGCDSNQNERMIVLKMAKCLRSFLFEDEVWYSIQFVKSIFTIFFRCYFKTPSINCAHHMFILLSKSCSNLRYFVGSSLFSMYSVWISIRETHNIKSVDEQCTANIWAIATIKSHCWRQRRRITGTFLIKVTQ